MMKPYRYVHRHYSTICRYADRQSKRHSAKKFSHFINLVIIIYFTQDMSAYQKHCQRVDLQFAPDAAAAVDSAVREMKQWVTVV